MSLNTAITLHLSGRLDEAIRTYRDVLDHDSANFDANHLLGVALYQRGEPQSAIRFLRYATTVDPSSAFAWNNLGCALKAVDQITDAELAFEEALKILPNYVEALDNFGDLMFKQGSFEKSADLHSRAIMADSSRASRFGSRAAALLALGRADDARRDLEYLLAQDPNDSYALRLRARIRSQSGDISGAIDDLQSSVKLNPQLSDAFFELAELFRRQDKVDSAVEHYKRALNVDPSHLGACNALGSLNLTLNRYESALTLFDSALLTNPKSPETWCNRSRALLMMGQLNEAKNALDRSIQINPNFVEAQIDLGHLLVRMGAPTKAIDHYQRARTLEPNKPDLLGQILVAKLFACDWGNIDSLIGEMENKVANGAPVTPPFVTLLAIDKPSLQRRAAETHIKRRTESTRAMPARLNWVAGEKIRIGYFSSDFYSHATAHLMARVFELHDRKLFETHAFSFSPTSNDSMSARLRKAFDAFYDVKNLSDQEISSLSRQKNIHIAIDLKGYTQGCRPRIFANRCAPIQVNYLGYPGTSGAEHFDFILADEFIIPEKFDHHYSETVIRLNTCYQPNGPLTQSTFIPTRKQYRLPENTFVFCCFNHQYKILPETFQAWMQILSSVPGSVLWLYASNNDAQSNLQNAARRFGVNPSRLIFADSVNHAEHLARLSLADLFLDTYPYTAHTTASDALRSHLPVLTLPGETFASRVAASLLRTLDLQELIAVSRENYVGIATLIAESPSTLAAIRSRLQTAVSQSPLFDSVYFTRRLESSLLKIMLEWADAN